MASSDRRRARLHEYYSCGQRDQWPGLTELLHAQLQPNEVRLCWKDLPPMSAPVLQEGDEGDDSGDDRIAAPRMDPAIHVGFLRDGHASA